MSQSTLEDEDLFGEAADELRTDVEEELTAAEAALPDADAIWTAEADNVLGVLNTLRTTLQADEAREHLRQAKKWYALGERADAFEEESALGTRLEDLEETVADIETVHEAVDDAAGSLPGLRERLDEGEEAATPSAD